MHGQPTLLEHCRAVQVVRHYSFPPFDWFLYQNMISRDAWNRMGELDKSGVSCSWVSLP